VIDGHVHLWQIGRHACAWPGPDLPPLYRDFTLEDLWREREAGAVERVILVQSQPDVADTRWLLSLAISDARIAGVVGWVDLAATDIIAQIAQLRAAGPLVGVRPMVQDLADDWFDDPALDVALACLAGEGLTLDALIRPRHLAALGRLAERHPSLSIIIDHAAKPDNGAVTADWIAAMARLASLPNVACKLSGLLTELPDDAPDVAAEPCIDRLYRLFGADRLIWGSDWPVLTLRQSYSAWLALARQAVPVESHGAIFGGNATRIYGLAA